MERGQRRFVGRRPGPDPESRIENRVLTFGLAQLDRNGRQAQSCGLDQCGECRSLAQQLVWRLSHAKVRTVSREDHRSRNLGA